MVSARGYGCRGGSEPVPSSILPSGYDAVIAANRAIPMYGSIFVGGAIGNDDAGAALMARATSTLNAWHLIGVRRCIYYDARVVLSSRTAREIDDGTVRR